MPGRLFTDRRALRFALVAVALALLAAGLLTHGAAARRSAPALPSRVLSGAPVTLAALRGHPAAVVFWASWCTDCHVEASAVERFARSPAGRGRVVGIDYSDGGDWRGFLRRYGWSFPILADPDGATLDGFGITASLPVTAILDPSGRIASAMFGVQTVARLRSALAAAS